MKIATALFVLLLAAGAARAECDKLSIVDAKALTQEQLRGRICRDMQKRNFYIDSANSFTTKPDLVYSYNGLKFVSRRNSAFYYSWMAELKSASVCQEAFKSNSETFADLYADTKPGCDEPHRAEQMQLGP